MCKCTPEIRTPFCGKPGCEVPEYWIKGKDALGQKQPENSKSCAGYVAAMIAGVHFKVFDDEVKSQDDGSYTFTDVAKFLLERGFGIGIGFNCDKGSRVQVNEKTVFLIDFQPITYQAFVTVYSERYPDAGHAVYWDGEKVWDPNPKVKDCRPLSDYRIKSWYPVYKIIGENVDE